MKYAAAAVALNIVLGLILFRLMGFAGIAAATAAASLDERDADGRHAGRCRSTTCHLGRPSCACAS